MTEETDISDLVQTYQERKLEKFESMKRLGIAGVIRGGYQFLEHLIKLQTSDNAFGQNVQMIQFRDNIKDVLNRLQ